MNRVERKLCFVTWNTLGIKKTSKLPEKLSTLLEKLNESNAEIVFIQETRVGPECYSILKDVCGWRAFFTVYDSQRKGVAILIKSYKKMIKEDEVLPFEYICHDEDYSGGYFVLFCRLYGELFTLVNVYKHKYDREVLYRLKDYLREVAEGVLVIGGDFNTVLDPEFDRKPTVVKRQHSGLRDMLKKFMSSLNLIDMWSHFHPTDESFTRSQNNSYSRLDMFFMPEDTMDRVISCEINKKANEPKISDHHPLILTLRVQQQVGAKLPNVASMLKVFEYCVQPYVPHKINGAEILSAIKSLTDSGKDRPDKVDVHDYKMFRCPMTESLKLIYNQMLKDKVVPLSFKTSDKCGTFNVNYLIFCQILANRLRMFLTIPLENTEITKFPIHLQVSFVRLPKTIRWTLLKHSLRNLHDIVNGPPQHFSILKTLLPEGSGSSKEVKLLCKGCPLTRPILTLVLTHLAKEIACTIDPEKGKKQMEKKTGDKNKKEVKLLTNICHSRHVLFLHVRDKDYQTVDKFIKEFEIKYEIKLNVDKKESM